MDRSPATALLVGMIFFSCADAARTDHDLSRNLLADTSVMENVFVKGGQEVHEEDARAEPAVQEPACRTGATAIADAYVLSNPLYSLFLGDLEQYVMENAAHFGAEGDAVRCAKAMSRGFLRQAIQLYDPSDRAMRDELNARLGEMGISPGPPESTPSTELLTASRRLARLARVLPAAADGDFGPLRTPADELERMEMVAGQTLHLFARDPDMAWIMSSVEGLVRELAALDHRAIQDHAAVLAGQSSQLIF